MPEQRTWTRADLPEGLNRALDAAIERGARAPVVLRLNEVAGYTDWALLLSARSDRQVRGVVEGIQEALAGVDGVNPLGSDGLDLHLWALLDYDDFLIHVFYHPVRRHYDLESMWSDAPRVELDLPADILDARELDGLAAPDPMPAYRGDMTFGGFEDEFVDDEDDDEDELDEGEFVDDEEFGGPSPSDDDLFEDDAANDSSTDDDLFEP